MADSGGEGPSGKRLGEGSSTGLAPTGTYMTSEGESIETEEDIATRSELPSTREIIESGGVTVECREGPVPEEQPAPPRARRGISAGGAPGEEVGAEEPLAPHDEGRMPEIE